MKIRTVILALSLLCAVAFGLFFTIMQEKERDGHWPWPLNGQIHNQSDVVIQVWDDDHGHYSVAAKSESSRNLDIDHAKEPGTGRWCKLGEHTLIVAPNGRFENCPCYALKEGRPCIKF
ncbi:hypothetical protein HQ393_09110 [Chitinibacter bivalviorum]|uniref:Uncharacterized protein n=1 Tax=Chitinibacter bivalviorum TaxID=2739434 RepID=A0A7H9BI45_9NEIS|nr:hypothetical protein [Chitinibacter bivalviorum]QLG88393.1 hypothetical protein HQ393_09110 [Chitinibacter bivalviorum]